MNPVTTWSLESNSADELVPAANPGNCELHEARVKQFAFNRFLYQMIGDAWGWHDKLQWNDTQWRDYAEAENLRTWVLWVEGSPAGYFELQMQEGGAVEIAYFGLSERFFGRGLGGYLLTAAIREAWHWGASRVWVHTCTLDHPNALRNYQARGLRIFRTEEAAGV